MTISSLVRAFSLLCFGLLLLAGCGETVIEDKPWIDPEFTANAETARAKIKPAQLLWPSPEGDLKPAEDAPPATAEKKPVEAPPQERLSVAALLERWSQPDEPLQIHEIFTGKLGKEPSHVAFTADGELLYIALFDEARHLLFQTKDGQKVLDVQYGDAPLTAANISPDGKYILASKGATGSGVYDIAAEKEAHLFTNMKNATSLHASSGENAKAFCARADGGVCAYPILGGRGGQWLRGEAVQKKAAGRTDKVQMAVASDGAACIAYDPANENNLIWLMPGADPKNFLIRIESGAGGPVAAGKHVYAETLNPGDLTLRVYRPGEETAQSSRFTLSTEGNRFVSVAPNDRFAAYLQGNKRLLYVISCQSSAKKSAYLKDPATPSQVAFDWSGQRIAAGYFTGRITVSRFANPECRADEIEQEIARCLADKDDERLEQIAAALEDDPSRFPSDAIHGTKYSRFAQSVMARTLLGATAERKQQLQEWLERNPKSRLARICRAKVLISQGWAARGSGSAYEVTPEGWRVLGEKMAAAREILESFKDEAKIPGEAYTLIFDIAKAESWPKEKTEYYVDRLFRESPRYISAHTHRMADLLPRWGGEPDDCRQYAERVAQAIGGKDGDAAYAMLVSSLIHYANHGINAELGFDSKRYQAGLDHLFRDDPDNAQYWQLGMMLAAIANDRPRAKMFADKILARQDPFAGLYCSEGQFERLLQAASFVPPPK